MKIRPIALLALAALATGLGLAPPSGRPPVGPLSRHEPRIYDVSFGVNIVPITAMGDPTLHLKDTPIVMPVIYQGTFSRVDPDSVDGRVLLDTGAATNLERKVEDDRPFYTHHLVMTVPEYVGQSLRWRVSMRTQSWSSRLDDARAAAIPWPRTWPDEVQDGLKPQMYVDPDADVFQQAIERNGGHDALHTVTPHLAAKQVVAFCLNNVMVDGSDEVRNRFGLLQGMRVQNASKTAEIGRGSEHDLVAVCVAMLRAAGIPARPVVGMERDEEGKETLVSWAEFHLPDAGWVPFDPVEMQGDGVHRRPVNQPWPHFGTMDELNERVPLSYHFHPPAPVEALDAPGLWGWRPNPPLDSRRHRLETQVEMQMISRGLGRDDPR